MHKVWIILSNSSGELERQSVSMEWPVKAADQICDLIRAWNFQPGDRISVEEYVEEAPDTFAGMMQRSRQGEQ